jgi:hypothetical protein
LGLARITLKRFAYGPSQLGCVQRQQDGLLLSNREILAIPRLAPADGNETGTSTVYNFVLATTTLGTGNKTGPPARISQKYRAERGKVLPRLIRPFRCNIVAVGEDLKAPP